MIVWFRSLLESLNEQQSEGTVKHEDNTECMSLAKGEWKFLTSKHIGLRNHYQREYVGSNEIKVVYVHTEDQLADLITKPLAMKLFEFLMNQVLNDSVMEFYNK